MSDDISFCPIEKCRRTTCKRNQRNIRDRGIPHSFFVERPPDCPYRKRQDDFYHIRQKGGTTMPDREKVIKGLKRCTKDDGSECPNCPYFSGKCTADLMADALAMLEEQEEHEPTLEEWTAGEYPRE